MFPFFVEFVVGLFIAYWPSPKPEEDKKAVPFNRDAAPVAEEGKEIPVLFGTRELKAPNVVWWGDTKAIPVKSSGSKKG